LEFNANDGDSRKRFCLEFVCRNDFVGEWADIALLRKADTEVIVCTLVWIEIVRAMANINPNGILSIGPTVDFLFILVMFIHYVVTSTLSLVSNVVASDVYSSGRTRVGNNSNFVFSFCIKQTIVEFVSMVQ